MAFFQIVLLQGYEAREACSRRIFAPRGGNRLARCYIHHESANTRFRTNPKVLSARIGR
jgi:hypothetical protein